MSSRIIKGDKSNLDVDKRGLGQFYFESAEKHGDKICQIDATTGQKESYKSVKQRSTRLAVHMRNLGLKPNDVVVCCMRNTINSLIPILSSLYLGAKVSSLNPSQSVRECAHCISIVKPKCIFVEEESVQLMENALDESELEATIIVVGKSEKYRTFSELLESISEENNFRPVPIANYHETAFIYFSSGTTGLPKGICMTHFGLLNGPKSVWQMDVIDASIVLLLSHFCWISTIGFTTMLFLAGGYRIFASKFEAKDILPIIEISKVTTIVIPPIFTYYLASVDGAEKYDTSSLKRMVLGGTPISPIQLQKTRKFFKHTFITMVYGSTETGYISTFDYTKDRHLIDRLESCGRCVDDAEVKIVDVKTKEVLGPNQKGEICVRHPYTSSGYYNNTTTRFCDEDGFIETGDMGYYDDDECLYVVGRLKEMFKYQTWHIVPPALEAVLQEHPSVKEAAVIGIPHEIDEFRPAACVVLKDGAETTEEEIQKFYNARVADYEKLIEGIKFVASLPKSSSDKLQRFKIKELFFKK